MREPDTSGLRRETDRHMTRTEGRALTARTPCILRPMGDADRSTALPRFSCCMPLWTRPSGVRRLSPDLAQRAGLPAARLRDQPAQDCAVSNRYNAWFKPTQSGVYAFWITRRLAATSENLSKPLEMHATFGCGVGTQSSTPRFHCVVDPSPFPGDVAG